MMSTEPGTSDIRIVRAPSRTDDIACALRSAYSEPLRLPDHWIRLLTKLDRLPVMGRSIRKAPRRDQA